MLARIRHAGVECGGRVVQDVMTTRGVAPVTHHALIHANRAGHTRQQHAHNEGQQRSETRTSQRGGREREGRERHGGGKGRCLSQKHGSARSEQVFPTTPHPSRIRREPVPHIGFGRYGAGRSRLHPSLSSPAEAQHTSSAQPNFQEQGNSVTIRRRRTNRDGGICGSPGGHGRRRRGDGPH